jgi:hypothetical protein
MEVACLLWDGRSRYPWIDKYQTTGALCHGSSHIGSSAVWPEDPSITELSTIGAVH